MTQRGRDLLAHFAVLYEHLAETACTLAETAKTIEREHALVDAFGENEIEAFERRVSAATRKTTASFAIVTHMASDAQQKVLGQAIDLLLASGQTLGEA